MASGDGSTATEAVSDVEVTPANGGPGGGSRPPGASNGQSTDIEFVWVPRLRRAGRRLLRGPVWLSEFGGRVGRRLLDPNHRPGRWRRWFLLLRPWRTFTLWVVAWLVAIVVSGYFLFVRQPDQPWSWLLGWVLGASFAAFVATIWHDGVMSPHVARRARRRIRSDPLLLKQPTLAEHGAKIIELHPPVNTVPREDLYEELLPGALAKDRDVQVIVGVPGAGKTTALLDLAGVLARNGLVPVLLEMRGHAAGKELFDLARARFEEQVRPLVKVEAQAGTVWQWLCRRKRVAVLVDDIDQIAFDGEPGFAIRRLLENAAAEGQTVIATARLAGVPMGMAASAVTIEELSFDTAVELVAQPAKREPGATVTTGAQRSSIERWVRAGQLTEAPLYLEALAELASVGECPGLPDDPRRWSNDERPGRWRELSEHKQDWAPLWVRYLLLGHYYRGIVEGEVRRSLAIDSSDRKRCMRALEDGALGTLGAIGLEASSERSEGDKPTSERRTWPKRRSLADFISSDDRRSFESRTVDSKRLKRRRDLSQHEVVDTGERLRILDRDWRGEPQFRHRIMQAYLAGRRLAELRRLERACESDEERASAESVRTFDRWVSVLIDPSHPEKLTAQLALTFAAIYADEATVDRGWEGWDDVSLRIISGLLDEVPKRAPGEDCEEPDDGAAQEIDCDRVAAILKELDPMRLPYGEKRRDHDDELIKLTTAASIVGMVREKDPPASQKLSKKITKRLIGDGGAMRWTKLQALPALASIDEEEAWPAIWSYFTPDHDYAVRRAASRELETNAWSAYPRIGREVSRLIKEAERRVEEGRSLQHADRTTESGWNRTALRKFMALGWVLPPIVSGLSEERGGDLGTGAGPDWRDGYGPGSSGNGSDRRQESLRRARNQLERFTELACQGGRHELEESLAQGFKADALRHVGAAGKANTGPGWVAANRRLVADVALPYVESWYARMLLYQALALYSIAGASEDDTLDVIAHRLHATRERNPYVREAARLGRAALRRARIRGERWAAFVWSDEVEDGGRVPTMLGRRATQLIGDVAVLVDLKEGSPPDRHATFGHMEELPYCLDGSPDRHEILGTGCPAHCGWRFCPYRAAAPDEPNEQRGIGRSFCRAQRRAAKRSARWQGRIRRRRLREFWRQMEYKARR